MEYDWDEFPPEIWEITDADKWSEYCKRCGDPGPAICESCRVDLWEWAESYGGEKQEIEKRVYDRMQEIRHGGVD